MNKHLVPVALILATSFAASLSAQTPQPSPFGSTPNWEDYKRVGSAALKNALIDPDSAKIEWPYVAISGTLKGFMSKSTSGFYTCGLVNARNRMGGYTGRVYFLIVIKDGIVQELDIGSAEEIDTATVSCKSFVKKAVFPIAAPSIPPTPAQ